MEKEHHEQITETHSYTKHYKDIQHYENDVVLSVPEIEYSPRQVTQAIEELSIKLQEEELTYNTKENESYGVSEGNWYDTFKCLSIWKCFYSTK